MQPHNRSFKRSRPASQPPRLTLRCTSSPVGGRCRGPHPLAAQPFNARANHSRSPSMLAGIVVGIKSSICWRRQRMRHGLLDIGSLRAAWYFFTFASAMAISSRQQSATCAASLGAIRRRSARPVQCIAAGRPLSAHRHGRRSAHSRAAASTSSVVLVVMSVPQGHQQRTGFALCPRCRQHGKARAAWPRSYCWGSPGRSASSCGLLPRPRWRTAACAVHHAARPSNVGIKLCGHGMFLPAIRPNSAVKRTARRTRRPDLPSVLGPVAVGPD